jgi:hypothetical protein
MRGPDRVPLEWVFLGVDLVLLDVVYRWLHVRLRGAVSAVIVIISAPFVAPHGRVGVVGGAAVI